MQIYILQGIEQEKKLHSLQIANLINLLGVNLVHKRTIIEL